MILKDRHKTGTSSREMEGMSNPPRRQARRTSQTSITLRIMMLANLVIFFTLCFFLNRILTIGLMNNIRDDYQAPSLVRKERDTDCSQKQRSIKPCPIAEKRADLQLLPVLRKKHDKDYYRNKYGKDYLPLAWLMSFPGVVVNSYYFVYYVCLISRTKELWHILHELSHAGCHWKTYCL
jgi:hypothetical protein